MTKEQFIMFINQIERHHDYQSAYIGLQRAYEFDYAIDDRAIELETSIVDLLEINMNDEKSFISQWIYACEFGIEPLNVSEDKTEPLNVSEDKTEPLNVSEDKTEYVLDTAGKLYDFLVEYYADEK